MVVGDDVDDDLALARTLLGAVLFAVEGTAPGVEWATAVLRTSFGAVVVLTSTEGRGWLPAGLFLPSEVLVAWRWESLVSDEDHPHLRMLEGDTDPARVLSEFIRYVCRTRNGQLSAIASSTTVNNDVRATIGYEVAVADRVPAAESAVDLSRPGVGLVDRLDAAGSAAMLQRANEIPDSDIRATCLRLAQAADELVRDATRGAAAQVFARYDHARMPSDAGTEHTRVFGRRVDELASLLSTGYTDRQLLRDAVYAHGQIAEHPLFRSTTRSASTETVGSISGDTASGHRRAVPSQAVDHSRHPVNPALHGEQRSI
ncbi:hypothetical protein [Nocardia nova]|uniref:hypothetical protein n=1 Tax=Nocardia nova TaxID=37330 RepID=UPI0033D583AE